MADRQLNINETVQGVSGKELQWSQWWIDHRDRVRRIAIGLFVALDVILVSSGVWGFTDWLALGGVREEQAIRQMTSAGYAQFNGISLQEVRVDQPIVLPASSGKVDILVPVENPNTHFWAELQYRLVVGGTEQPLRTAFILPGQTKYLAELSAPAANGPSAEVKVEKRIWHRATPQGGVDQAAFAETRLNIQGENAVFKPADPLATAPSSSASFTLANHTAFSYYDVGVLVLLYQNDTIIGANEVHVDALAAGERKPMEIFWYQPISLVTKVDVVPDLNIYDPNVYRKPGT